MKPQTITQSILIHMLKECTGTQSMDSGGQNNRHWQKNQSRNFMLEPEQTLHLHSDNTLTVTKSLFHFLDSLVTVDLEGNREFRLWAQRPDSSSLSHLGLLYKWQEVLEIENWDIINSYNYDNDLDQNMQFLQWTSNDKIYYLISIHGGCDVRVGYSFPHMFTSDVFITYTNSTVSCDSCESSWYMDDSISIRGVTLSINSWYPEYGELEELSSYTLNKDSAGLIICPHCEEGNLE